MREQRLFVSEQHVVAGVELARLGEAKVGCRADQPSRCRGTTGAPGLTARSALAKFAAVQMIDVHLPTTDGREIILTRTTEPEPELRLLLDRMNLAPPAQPPPRIVAASLPASPASVVSNCSAGRCCRRLEAARGRGSDLQ